MADRWYEAKVVKKEKIYQRMQECNGKIFQNVIKMPACKWRTNVPLKVVSDYLKTITFFSYSPRV